MRRITVGVVDISESEKHFVVDALDSNRLSAGKYTRAFEAEFARLHDCRYAVMCNSGTSALQVALAALKEVKGWQDGDEIIVPAITFIATSNVVLYNGLVPKFVDVDPVYYNIDARLIERAVSARTRAIIPVHLFGLPCEMDPILAIAKKYDLEIIEDSCETMFARYKGSSVGSFGAMACFSTYAAHLLVTGVGGIITTNEEEYALICRSLIAHGRDTAYLGIDDDDQVDNTKLEYIISKRFSFVRLGFSYRVTELEGALAYGQLLRKDEMMTRRRENAEKMISRLREFEEYLQLPCYPPYSDHAFMLFPIVVKENVGRDHLVNFLEANGIETRYMFPLLDQPVYRKLFANVASRYSVASHISRCGFYIGCHHQLTDDDIEYIYNVFAKYFSGEFA